MNDDSEKTLTFVGPTITKTIDFKSEKQPIKFEVDTSRPLVAWWDDEEIGLLTTPAVNIYDSVD